MNTQEFVNKAIEFILSESIIQTLMYIAIPTTFHSTSLLNSISFKNAVYFLMFFSWISITFIQYGTNHLLSLIFGIVGSLLFTLLLNISLTLLLRLQEDNTTKLSDAQDLYGEVYLTVYKNKTGKVELVLNGAKRIYDARADKGTIKTGSKIKIIDTDEDTGILTVTKDF